jgi:uncharacterized protein
MNTLLVVCSAGFFAGAMNAVTGGGSFVTLPALIAVGVPPVLANTSSTVALFPGGLASAWAFRDGLRSVGAVSLRALLATTVCGGLVGEVLLLRTSSSAFGFLLPWLLLIASVALAFGRRIGTALSARCHIHGHAVLAIQFALGIYGGYFGGAVGMMMVAMWGLIDDSDLKQFNAPRTLLVCAANVVAVLTFVVANAVRWPETLVMLVGAIIGGYGGARIGRRASPRVIRATMLLSTWSITAVYFARTYAFGWLPR